ncbi:MAG: acetate--CoA ligase family protein, partial [Mycobacteriales bacterium]
MRQEETPGREGALVGDRDASGRPLRLRDVDLDRFFHPGTVAVLGASDTEGRPNTGVWRGLRDWGARRGATVFPVNPSRDSVDGLTCYPSLTEVPAQIDLAVLLVGDPVTAMAEVLASKAAFAVVFASGFAETGALGRAAQDRLTELVSGSALHLLGPNTNLNAFETFREDLAGPAIALITQSGHQGRPIFALQEMGVRVSHWAPTGNEADLEIADFLRYFADLPDVGAIAVYAEGFANGRTLTLAADHALVAGTPVVMVKVGRTAAGRSMAESHTGKLTGADDVASAALRQFGVVRVEGLDELADTATLLARARPPRGDGVCIYAISGGTGAHLADMCAAAGLALPELGERTQQELHEWIPPYLRVSNPVDNGGHPVGDWRGRRILDTLLADPAVDVLVAPITGAFPPMSDQLARDLVEAAESTDKLVCVIWGSPVGTESAYRDVLLSSSRVVVFRTFGNCVQALRSYFDWHQLRERYRSPFALLPGKPSPAAISARLQIGPGPTLAEHASAQLLAEFGIRRPREELVRSAAQAGKTAARLGYPVVCKANAAGLAHKSELGLVRIGLTTAGQVRAAYADIAARAAAAGIDLSG